MLWAVSGIAAPLPGNIPTNQVAVLLEFAGQVEWTRAGSAEWAPARTNLVLREGDRLRIGDQSRATLRLGDLTTFRVGPLSLFQLTPQRNGVTLWRGLLYFFHRDKPGHYEIRTPTAYAVIRGTEFTLDVGDDLSTRIYLVDGQVELTNQLGRILLENGQGAQAAKNQAPTRVALDVRQSIQWTLYYPAILDPAELNFSPAEQDQLRPSLTAYQAGDVLAALSRYPAPRQARSAAEQVYHAALLLAAGQVTAAESELARVIAMEQRASRNTRLAEAVGQLIAVAQGATNDPPVLSDPPLASELLARSYAFQAQARLEEALAAARAATVRSPHFAFAWTRVAELEFSFGRIRAAEQALDHSLALAPRNAQAVALRGFLLAARNDFKKAFAAFDQSIALDGSLGNGWLGRGLCRIRMGQTLRGRDDLQVAATVEPRRALLRAYLGKAFAEVQDERHAHEELALAKQLDPADPTAFLYSALLAQQENRINEAARELERSIELNENRRLFRSTLLLDQDRAVRSANLASIYRDAGMPEVSLREAYRAVNTDPANYSAHLFLANSYDALRDPRQVNLRYETPWLSEYLVANLLAPAAAGVLSPNISQNEYGRFFERNRLGLSSHTEYLSRGDWLQNASQFGQWNGSAYAIDVSYRSENGHRANNDFEQLTTTLRLKQEITPADALFFQALYYDAEAGDVNRYYNEDWSNRFLRQRETQEPILLAGYHREWSPGVHTLLLAGRLQDTHEVSNPQQQTLLLARDAAGQVMGVAPVTLSQEYRSELEIYTAELQHLWQIKTHGLTFGARLQAGEAHTENTHTNADFAAALFQYDQTDVTTDLNRVSVYAYDHWQLLPSLLLVGGVSYDRVQYPANFRYAPLSDNEATADQLSPKAGLIWTPTRSTTLRGAYARGLTGTSIEQSFQLEPTQIAGINQAFRSLIPESVAGANAAASFDVAGVSVEQKIGRSTYLGLSGEWLASDLERKAGIYNFAPPAPITASQTREELDFTERSLAFTINQLLSQEWSIGGRYRVSHASFSDQFSEIPDTAQRVNTTGVEGDVSAVLHRADLFVIYQHASGFFGQAQSSWYRQSNHGYGGALPGDDFWQFDLFAGYRFWQRRAEVMLGLLNLTDQDYHLNPLNLISDPPHDRTLVVRLKLFF